MGSDSRDWCPYQKAQANTDTPVAGVVCLQAKEGELLLEPPEGQGRGKEGSFLTAFRGLLAPLTL